MLYPLVCNRKEKIKMAENHSSENSFPQNIDIKYYNRLDIDGFSKMMKDPAYCYKFYWLEAIVNLISKNQLSTTFDAIIDEMISNAWYSVMEFHIHLSGLLPDGNIGDGLERSILLLSALSNLSANATKKEIKNEIKTHNASLRKYKEQLTNMVPYRALAGFFSQYDFTVNWNSQPQMTAFIRKFNEEITVLPYTFGDEGKLKKQVYFHPEWAQMIRDNIVAILGWIQFEKVKWLQYNNPEVPSLVYKLTSMDEKTRKLTKVRKLWEAVLSETPIQDIFTNRPICNDRYDIDHFIPWSFVMNDELWNLMPMDSSLNSAKNNRLPYWDPFFDRFAENQFVMYEAVNRSSVIRRLFQNCYKDNIHSIWAVQELYRSGNSKELFLNILHKNMAPIYDSARRQGYEIWEFH